MLFLFVEVDENVAKAFAELAASLGHRAEVAHSGGDALRMTGNTRYDTVFMDISLPDSLRGDGVPESLGGSRNGTVWRAVSTDQRHGTSSFTAHI